VCSSDLPPPPPRGPRAFDPARLVLVTAPLEARGGVLGAVTLAALPAQAGTAPGIPGRPAPPGSTRNNKAGGGCTHHRDGAASAPAPPLSPDRPAYPAADGLTALAAALGPCLALARVQADLASAATATGAAPPTQEEAGPSRLQQRLQPAACAATARLAAAGYDPDGLSLSEAGSGSEDGGDIAAAATRAGSSATSAATSAKAVAAPPNAATAAAPRRRRPHPSPFVDGYDAAAAQARARWDGPRLGVLAAGGCLWALHCGRATALLPLLPAALLACLRAWAATAAPPGAGAAWYAARRGALTATPRVASGLLALAAPGCWPPPPLGAAVRCASAWLAAWALLVPAPFATLVAQHCVATAAAALTAAAASGAARDAAAIAVVGGVAPLAVAAVCDEWHRDAYNSARLARRGRA
jgi:hypothetical protein